MRIDELKSAEVLVGEDAIRRVRELAGQRGEGLSIDESAGVIRATRLGVVAKAAIPEEMNGEPSAQAEAVGVTWSDDLKDRWKDYVASDERVDGHGDIVRQNWHFDEFDKNPVLANGHDWGAPPIGSVIAHAVGPRKSEDYDGPALYARALFATAETSEVADSVFRLVSSGFMRAASVGFYSSQVIDVRDEDERAKLGLGRWGLILDENHLLELSPVTLPANSGAGVLSALAQAKRAGRLESHDFLVLRELERRRHVSTRAAEAWREADRSLRGVHATLFPGRAWEQHKDLDEPFLPHAPRRRAAPTAGLPQPTAEVESLRGEIAHLRALVEEGFVGLSSTIADVREALDDIRTGGDTPRDVDELEVSSRLGSALELMDNWPKNDGDGR